MHSIVASSGYHVAALDLENAGEGIDDFGVAARANERPVCGPGVAYIMTAA
jgi:hypothetical protein